MAFHVLEHSLANLALTTMRDEKCGMKAFRESLRQAGRLLAVELFRNLELEERSVVTPLGLEAKGYKAKRKVVLVPILRAGLGLFEGFLDIFPSAKVGHIGLARDEETLQPYRYLCKLPPNIGDAEVLVIDPMLATGHSAVAAVEELRKEGAKRLRFACLVAAPEGVEHLSKAHPDVEISAVALDECLNEIGYILPGLGDAGDRYFGTL